MKRVKGRIQVLGKQKNKNYTNCNVDGRLVALYGFNKLTRTYKTAYSVHQRGRVLGIGEKIELAI